MASKWVKTKPADINQYGVPGYVEEPLDIYQQRYTSPAGKFRVRENERYLTEVLKSLGGSLLIVGSGHPDNASTIYSRGSFYKVVCLDIVSGAGNGLGYDIDFIHDDLTARPFSSPDSITYNMRFDYVFSAHTLEHFSKEVLFDVVFPELIYCSKKAVITVVPYGEAWSGEPSHKCRFYENDEFAAMNDYYKIIFGGKEIAYWKSAYD